MMLEIKEWQSTRRWLLHAIDDLESLLSNLNNIGRRVLFKRIRAGRGWGRTNTTDRVYY